MPDLLLVDDDEMLRETIHSILVNAGYNVQSAASGHEALALFRQHPADLVILDMIMPEGEGIETIMELQRSYGGVKIIAISGGGRVNARDYLAIAHKLGAMTLAKPFTSQEILAAVQKALAPTV